MLGDITRCRTAALDGHVDVCSACHFERLSYNSCRNRHCPKCQALAQHRWLERRLERILPTHHFHVVFTLPAELRSLCRQAPTLLYDLLFESATTTFQFRSVIFRADVTVLDDENWPDSNVSETFDDIYLECLVDPFHHTDTRSWSECVGHEVVAKFEVDCTLKADAEGNFNGDVDVTVRAKLYEWGVM